MRVVVAMSGGVDSSVAAALLVEAGHEVVGATMKLWGGEGDRGCCSVSDVDDARRVAQQLAIPHHVFNFSDSFAEKVVGPYVADHAGGRTPNPCVECNRHVKFDLFMARARRLGFDAVATGHHARVERSPAGHWRLLRGADTAKDQSYVLHMLGQEQLSALLLPIGAMTKAGVREEAGRLRLRTAQKPDSQDVCFISRRDGRAGFLGSRIPLRPARLIDADGRTVGSAPAVELLTVGQRRGLGNAGGGYVVDIDIGAATARIGTADELLVGEIRVTGASWVHREPSPAEPLLVQVSAHGQPSPARWNADGMIEVHPAIRRVAPGQSVVLYRDDEVVGGGIAA